METRFYIYISRPDSNNGFYLEKWGAYFLTEDEAIAYLKERERGDYEFTYREEKVKSVSLSSALNDYVNATTEPSQTGRPIKVNRLIGALLSTEYGLDDDERLDLIKEYRSNEKWLTGPNN